MLVIYLKIIIGGGCKMSMYEDFVRDYPARCIDVLEHFYEQAIVKDREVTLLLMATAGGFVMPYERLKDGQKFEQPELDRTTHKEQMKRLEDELNRSIKNSTVFGEIIGKWRYGVPGEKHDIDNVLRIAESAKPIHREKLVSTAIKIVRHSIAHGNVLAIRSPRDQIQDLVFVSRDSNRDITSAHLIVLTPGDLREFLLHWFKLLERISQKDALKLLDSIAI